MRCFVLSLFFIPKFLVIVCLYDFTSFSLVCLSENHVNVDPSFSFSRSSKKPFFAKVYNAHQEV